MKTLQISIIFILFCTVSIISQIKISYEQPDSNTTQKEILQFSNEQYPTDGKTGEAITINGTVENLIDKDVNVLFVLQSDGYNTAWHMIDSKPSSLFVYENLTIPADKSINYQYKIRLLTHGTFFFQPRVDVRDLQDASGNYIQYETAGKRGTITITGEDVDKTNFVHTGSGASNAKMAASGNTLYAIWQGRGLGDHDDIYLVSSVDNGTSFSSPINISKSKKDSTEPVIAAEGRDVYALWRDNTDTLGEFSDMLVIGGDIHLPSYGGGRMSTGYADASSGKIILAGKTAYSTWVEKRSHNVVYFSSNPLDMIGARSHDISNSHDDSFNPQIASDGNNVFLAWEEHHRNGDGQTSEIYYSHSEDNGKTFHTISVSNDDNNSTNPKISLSDGNLYLAYQDSKNDLVLVKSTGNVTDLSNKNILHTGTPHLVLSDIEAESSNVNMLWQDLSQNDNSIFLSESDDYGNSFASPIRIGNITEPSSLHMASAGRNLYLTWVNHMNNGSNEILFKKSLDRGRTFDDTIILNNDENPMNPYVLASGNNVYVTWTDASTSMNHIFFRASHDEGKNFESLIYLTGTTIKDTASPVNIFEQILVWIKQIFHGI